jgi:hypothetical protein
MEAKLERQQIKDVVRASQETILDTEDVLASSVEPAAPAPARTAVAVFPGPTNDYHGHPPSGVDEARWKAELRKALGTSSDAFVAAALHRLLAVCTMPGEISPTSTGVSAAIALIQSLAPTSEIEAVMAVHIACLDAAALNVLSRVQSHGTERRIVISSNAAAKLERALEKALQAFQRLKHGNRQTIRIERLNVEAGANAVIGEVSSRR